MIQRYQRVKKKGYARLVTNLGPLNLELNCDQTTKTCENFIKLCQKGYYNGTVFHRSIKNFMVGAFSHIFTEMPHLFVKMSPLFLSDSRRGPNWDRQRWRFALGRRVRRRVQDQLVAYGPRSSVHGQLRHQHEQIAIV